MRKDDDPKFNSKTMWNEEPIDDCQKAVCEIKICRYEIRVPETEPVVVACKSYHWAAWARWTQCDLK